MKSVGFIKNITRSGSSSQSVAAESSESVEITLESGAVAVLEPAAASTVLRVLREREADAEPVFIETNDATRTLTRLLLPMEVTVDKIEELETSGDLEVMLRISHAKHWLRKSNPDFKHLSDSLRGGLQEGLPLLVTEEPDSHEIIHVQLLGKPERVAELAMFAETVAAGPPPPPPAPITAAKASEMFALVAGMTCAALAPSATCIPFLYPDDGCWGRAHEMGRLIKAAGVAAVKVWSYGSLLARSKNHPQCKVRWGYHVAVTVNVQDGANSGLYTIDPSLFTKPVPQLTWRDAQKDPASAPIPVLVNSELRVFYRDEDGGEVFDDNHTETVKVLKRYRQALMLRSKEPAGPPPYSACS